MVAHVLTALMSCAKAKATSVSIAHRRCSFRSCHADAPLLLCGVGYDHDAPVQSCSLCPAARLFFTGDGPGGGLPFVNHRYRASELWEILSLVSYPR